MPNTQSEGMLLSWQRIPAEILVSIIKPLIQQPRTSYIPLTCMHVCRHWRQVTYGTSSLWYFVDVARGASLTKLWLSNSAHTPIDVKIWYPPEEIYGDNEAPLSIPSAISFVQKQVERWRSLELACWCSRCADETITFLGRLKEPLLLDSLTIGPMGKYTTGYSDGRSGVTPALVWLTRQMKLVPSVLRTDSFFIPEKCEIFSARLTTIEFFSEVADAEFLWLMGSSFFARWADILRATPNLVSLTLWHSSKERNEPEQWSQGAISLPHLKLLSLNNRYVDLSLMLARSPLPSLKIVCLDSTILNANIPLCVRRVGAAAPHLTDLTLSHNTHIAEPAKTWGSVFRKLQSLEGLKLMEMDVGMALDILESPNLPNTLTDVYLERIDIEYAISWPPACLVSQNPPRLTVAGYDSNIVIRPPGGSCYVYCSNGTEKPRRCKNVPEERIFNSQDTEFYNIVKDLALARGPVPDLGGHENGDSDDSGRLSSEGSSYDTDSEASFASGDLYVIKQGQSHSPRMVYSNPDESWDSSENLTESHSTTSGFS